ncbi:MAG: hypothetical protein WCY82_08065 [Desulfotomaculaceae bacterium]
MTLESPVLVQIEGQWLALSGCGEVVALGAAYEDVLNDSLGVNKK